jgi:hypothetical protein
VHVPAEAFLRRANDDFIVRHNPQMRLHVHALPCVLSPSWSRSLLNPTGPDTRYSKIKMLKKAGVLFVVYTTKLCVQFDVSTPFFYNLSARIAANFKYPVAVHNKVIQFN